VLTTAWRLTAGTILGCGLLLATGVVHAQATSSGAGIYTCTDGKGRKLTSDRPIVECIDRTQKELNASGTVRRQIGPSLTAEEKSKLEEQEKQVAIERAREAEEKRRDRALLTRYPDRAAHDNERNEALGQVDEVMKAATKRIGELAAQRKAIDAELEFYKGDVSKAPPYVKRQLEENDRSVTVQKRFIGEQEGEKKRVNGRFDEELVKLKQLWLLKAPAK
jgi:ribosomal protein S17E